MTFGVSGLALLLFGWLAVRTGRLPGRIGQLALVGGVLLIVVYIGRLTVLNPESNVIRLAALASGLVVVPAVYVLFASTLLRPEPGPPEPPADATAAAA